jgi:hypothetical protein
MEFRRKSSANVDLSRLCPAPACINGIVWAGEGPTERCSVCKGHGRVSLSEWIKFTLTDAPDRTGSD